MNKVFRLAILGLAATSLLNCADDAGDPTEALESTETDAGNGARVHESPSGRPLTGPSSATANAIVGDFLRARIGVPGDQLLPVGETTHRGLTYVRFEHEVDGLRVHGAFVKATLSASGELMRVTENLSATSNALVRAHVAESDALGAAFQELGYDAAVAQPRRAGRLVIFARDPMFHRAPRVERVAVIGRGTYVEAFLVETWSRAGNLLDLTLVDGDGRIVSSERRTASDSYNVFAVDPDKNTQGVVSGPVGSVASPSGWLGAGQQSTLAITGNNTATYLDADGTQNVPDGGGTGVADGDFLTQHVATDAPNTANNRAVAVQNLFYLNNVIHDRLHRHGFTESAGNFQTDNFGRGGTGNDAVQAEAQDGGGTDNANFATPPDGSKPRMQMYLWSPSTPSAVITVNGTDRDGFASSFGPAPSAAGATGQLVAVSDGVIGKGTNKKSKADDGTLTDGCETLAAGSLAGQVALVDRGYCNFTVKVKNAQVAGAIGVIIANNDASAAFAAGGTDGTITIPSAMVSQADGAALRLLAGASTTLKANPVPALMRDGDLDSDIVYHEYGHGLTWRMIGGMSGPISGAIGEGASDVVAFLMNGDDAIGEYSVNNAIGIRTKGYAAFLGGSASAPDTYKKRVTGTEVHLDGELYAAIMWRLKENYLAAGLTLDDVWDDFVGGMLPTTASPSYEHMRDGMLAVSPTTARDCLVWEAFAHFGVGVGAKGTVRGTRVSITESFTKPSTCQ